MSRLVKPADLRPGDKVLRINAETEIVEVEVAETRPLKDGGQITAYRIYPVAWVADQAAISRDPARKHLSPFTVNVRNQVEVS